MSGSSGGPWSFFEEWSERSRARREAARQLRRGRPTATVRRVHRHLDVLGTVTYAIVDVSGYTNAGPLLGPAKQAGMTINPIVSRDITAANSALSAHQFRAAWSDYQAAYQALSS